MKSRFIIAALTIIGLITAASSFGASHRDAPLILLGDPGPDQTVKTFLAFKFHEDRKFRVIYSFMSILDGNNKCEITMNYEIKLHDVQVTSISIGGGSGEGEVTADSGVRITVENYPSGDVSKQCPEPFEGPIVTTVTVPRILLKDANIPVNTIYYNQDDSVVDGADFLLWQRNWSTTTRIPFAEAEQLVDDFLDANNGNDPLTARVANTQEKIYRSSATIDELKTRFPALVAIREINHLQTCLALFQMVPCKT